MNIAGKTDIGMVRSTNQDTFRIEALGEAAGMALVCDGMGGARAGDKASALARRHITDVIRASGFGTIAMEEAEIQQLMLSAIHTANSVIYRLSQRELAYTGMGTTVVLVLFAGQQAYVAHVGDSRLYLLRRGRFSQVTTDHSRVQELVDHGLITSDEARVHPERNVITRAVGTRMDVNVDLLTLPVEPGDRLLLCSDGLTTVCEDDEIADVVFRFPPCEAVERLIQMANAAGGYDNITAVIAEV